MHTGITGNVQTVTTSQLNSVVRADTLDRIPVFVNPHDLNRADSGTPANNEITANNSHSNSSSSTTQIVTQSQQPQVSLSNASTQQVLYYYLHCKKFL